METSHAAAETLVSIIIPVYRGRPYLGEAIDTALAQSWPWIEVIVVDDGSDDNGATQEIARGYGNRIRYIRKENGGVASALNAGIEAMRGRYFSWLSHDDRYHPRKVELQMERMRQLEMPAIIFGDYDVIRPDGSTDFSVWIGNGFESGKSIWAVLEGRINGCTLLIPKECFDACGTFDERLPTTQDYRLWFEMARRYPFIHVPGALVQHRVHEKQGSKTTRHIEEANLLWRFMLAELSSDETCAAAGSELAFAIRNLEYLRKSALHGARYAAENWLRRLARERETALVWADDGEGSGPDSAAGLIEEIGCRVAELFVIDVADTASNSVRLHQRHGLRPRTLVRCRADGLMPTLFDLADQIRSETLILSAPGFPLSRTVIQRSLERLWKGDAELILHRNTETSSANSWPASLLGAAISRPALAKFARQAAATDWASALSTAVAVTAAEDIYVAVRPSGQAAPKRTTGKLSAKPTGRGTLLICLHALGGGTAVYAELVAAMARKSVDVIFLWGRDQRIALSAGGARHAELKFDRSDGLDDVIDILRPWQVARADVMHCIGIENHIEELLARLGVPFDITLLDYHTIARTPHLTAADGVFIGEAAAADKEHEIWRSTPLPVLTKAERRIAPSRHTAAAFARIRPDLQIIPAQIPEPNDPHRFAPLPVRPVGDESLQILVVGDVVKHKGASMAFETATLAEERGLSLTFHLLGRGGAPAGISTPSNLHLYGGFEQDELNELVCMTGAHLAWLPFAAPETYSFALSDVLLQGLPVLTVGVGAIAERLDGRPFSWVLDPDDATAEGYLEWLVRLRSDRLQTPPRWRSLEGLPPLHRDFYRTDYLQPLLERRAGPQPSAKSA